MKKLHLLTLLTVLLFAGCNKDELGGGEKPTGSGDTEFLSPTHFYGKATHPETKGVAQRDNLWYPGTTIKVKLLNDPLGKASQVEEWAKEWEEFADITFNFVTEGDAHVRIGFDWNANRWVTWSYIGTDCKMVYDQTEATMSFAYWDYASEEEMRGDVLRAFGQVLGLELEHRHLDFDPAWTANIERYWASEINDVPWEILKKYVFDPLDAANTLQTDEYDPESIMIWPFARQYAGNTERYYNYELSDMDKAFIGTLYPKTAAAEDYLIYVKIRPGTDGYDLGGIASQKPVIVEWITDRVRRDTFPSTDGVSVFYDPGLTGLKEIILYGDSDAIIEFYIGASDLAEEVRFRENAGLKSLSIPTELSVPLDVTGLPLLEELYYGGFTGMLDLSRNGQLKTLNLSNARDVELDLSGNPLLESLYLMGVQTSFLDVSPLKNLKNLSFSYSELTELDLSENTQLQTLGMYNVTGLTRLDLSHNTKLTELSCTCPALTSLNIDACTELVSLTYKGQGNINLANQAKLTSLSVSESDMNQLDLSGNPLLSRLSLTDTKVTSLDCSHNPELYNLSVSGTPLQSLNVTQNPELMDLTCSNSLFETVDLSSNLHLRSFKCEKSNITRLDFSNNPYLKTVQLSGSAILNDQTELVNMAESLPVPTSGNGALWTGYSSSASWIRAICNAKNWNVY